MSTESYAIAGALSAKREKLAALLQAKLSRMKYCPSSFAQQRLWFVHQMDSESSAYHLPLVLRLTGPVDVDALQRSIDRVVARHEALRTTFRSQDGNVEQVIAAPGKGLVRFTDLAGLREDERASAIKSLIEATAARPFNLSTGPLIRVELVRQAESDYLLIVALHHIVCDGWGVGVMMREFSMFYEANVRGEEPLLDEPPIQYADYAIWQRERLCGDLLEQHTDYWRSQLAGAPLLEMPTDHPRQRTARHKAGRLKVSFTPEITKALNELSQREGVTLFMTLLAAFQLLLSQYTGQKDVSVGTVIANRGRAELETLIGFFANTLILRTDLSGNPTFKSLLARVRRTTLDAYQHQDLPFEKLVEVLHPDRNTGFAPLFQAMLVVQNTPQHEITLTGIKVEPISVDVSGAKFELSLALEAGEHGLRGELEYAADLFDARTMRRLLAHFGHLLETVAARPEMPISEISLISKQELRTIRRWNCTDAYYPKRVSVQHMFEDQAVRAPSAIAVSYEGGQLTYEELNRKANQLAHYLRKLNVGPEVRVGICLERSPELVIAVLGILKAGGAYLPLDPDYPMQRLVMMLQDAEVSVLLSSQAIAQKLSGIESPMLLLDRDVERIAQESQNNPTCMTSGENLAYVIYTSGSTGKPKGVAIQHASLMNLVWWHRRIYDVWADAKATLLASPSFDASVWEIWPNLTAGASISIADSETRLSPSRLREWLAREEVTISFLTTPLAEAFVENDFPENFPLRKLLTGGDQLRSSPRRPVPFEMINHYGPTESTVVTTCAAVTKTANQMLPTIGRPIANTRVYLLNPDGHPVPIGFPGEIYISSESLARGYLNRPELTAEKFVPNPFSKRKGDRLYRTGDLARFLPDGNIEFRGRIDGQVKIRGLRIELGEIEVALAKCAGVETCAVLAREDKTKEKQLVAYIVAPQGVSVGKLREELQQKLPAFMVPARFVVLEQLPITPNGKVNRAALPEPTDSCVESTYVAPSNKMEKLLVDLWSELLGIAKVGAKDDFFELGGHSLLATQLVSKLRTILDLEIPVRAVFESPTPAGLARWIESSAKSSATIPIRRISREEKLPLSFGQQRLWFLEQLEPGSAVYNVPMAVRMEGTLQMGALERSLRRVVERHEALRTVFAGQEGQPAQVIGEEAELEFTEQDLRSYGAEAEAEAARRMKEAARRGFNLAAGPLIRALLLRLEERQYVLLLNLHHIVSDGWSMGVLVREMGQLYRAEVEGGESGLADLPYQYADYAVWQREWLQGEALENQLRYWKKQMEGSPRALELPSDRVRPAAPSLAGGSYRFSLGEELSRQVRELSQRQGLTLFMTLLGGYQILLSRYSGQKDIVVGAPIANRNRSEWEGLIGLFVNTLVLRTQMGDNPRISELLQRAQESALEGYAHQDVPFEKLVEELRVEREMSHAPLFQVMFALQNAPLPPLELQGLRISPMELDSGTAKFDLSLYMMESEGQLQGWMEYSRDLFAAETVERMVGHYRQVLRAMVGEVEQRVEEVELLTAEEREQALVEWNRTERESGEQVCLQQLFEEQVERRPEATALVYRGQKLSYAELNSRANQLAHFLRRKGIRPEARVGLLLERSIDMVVACLAVLKAGGVYVALDIESPPERLQYMLNDAKPLALIMREHAIARVQGQSLPGVALLDRDSLQIARESQINPPLLSSSDNLAYLIYTSGSVGKPKGVLGPHRAMINRLRWMWAAFPFLANEVCCQKTAATFVDSIAEMFSPLLHGVPTVILPDEVVKDPSRFVSELAAHQVSRIVMVPTLLRGILETHGDLQGILPRLKLCVLSGEALPADIAIRFRQALPDCTLLNLYGSSEVCADATMEPVNTELSDSAVSIGRPIDNVQIFILDPNLNPVPVGVAGEITVSGVAVARGYLNDPELTASKFLPSIASSHPGSRMYRTGDLGRYLPDGRIQFLGRADRQVKIRGYRVEQEEVSLALREHPAVRDVELMVTGAGAESQLVAYLVVDKSSPPSMSELRLFLSGKLPQYMIPSHYVMLDALPLLPGGKVDKNSLPAPSVSRNGGNTPCVAPTNGMEEDIAAIWRKLLKLERVSVHDNFFDLGGNSFLMVRLQSELQNFLDRKLSVIELFQHPTIQSLAEHLNYQASTQTAYAEIHERISKGKRALARKKQAQASRKIQ